jgi:secretion/DNA translocation related CpaE-like protein
VAVAPCLFSAREVIISQVRRAAAAAGVDIAVETALGPRARWREPALVVLDAALLPEIMAAGLPRREQVYVVDTDQIDPQRWDWCVRVGAERVVVLPDAEDDLVAALGEVGATGPGDGVVIAVTGARGGAGASVFAVALALAAQRGTRPVVLADADPWSAGLDVLLGLEGGPGVVSTGHPPQGRLPAGTLLRALPSVKIGRGRLSVLLPSRGTGEPISAELLSAVMVAGRRAGAVLVVDVPRHPWPPADGVVEGADLTVVVVPSDVQGCFGAARLLSRLAEFDPTVGLVVRGPSPGGIGPDDVTAALAADVVARMRPEPGLERRIESGRPPGENARGPLGRAARAVLGSVGVAL